MSKYVDAVDARSAYHDDITDAATATDKTNVEAKTKTIAAMYDVVAIAFDDAKASKDAAYAVYIAAEESVTKAEADYDAAIAAVEEAFKATCAALEIKK
ncbi:MAG: hypothetical protein GY820_10370 [Gammaproteobacteria bacterium]|nr:hypothetical protein [Gammaproteobacteria bacterium]